MATVIAPVPGPTGAVRSPGPPWRAPVAVALVLVAANVSIFLLAGALEAGGQIPGVGRDAFHKLLGIADLVVALYGAGKFFRGRLRYFLTRLAMGIGTIFFIATVVYFLLNALPGQEHWYSHLVNFKGQTQAQREAILHHYGLDRPLYVQYLTYMNQLLQWPPDLGDSAAFGGSVIGVIAARAPATLVLMGAAYLVQVLIAIPIGVISAVKPYSRLDNFVTGFSIFGISIPNFWLGSMLIYAFAILPAQSGSSIFPVGGRHAHIDESLFSNLPDLAWHLALPVTVLAVQGIAYYARYTRNAMLDVLGQDYIRTARAKGLRERTVIFRHAFRNSLLPVITLAGLDIPQFFAGAIITEQVFNWQGMGQATVHAALEGDYLFVTGVLLILATLVVLGNLVADLVYTLADTRITLERAR